MLHYIVLSLNPITWIGDIMAKALELIWQFNGQNWGLAIIIFTVLIRLLLHPLNKKQMDSMKQMQDIAPEIEKIKKKYKGNNEKIQMETLNLYKERGINPAAGCLPLLIQMPILIALFGAIRGLSEQLATSSFLWIGNLAQPDMVLVILNGIVMFGQSYLQQKMMAGSAGGQNSMMMYMMPIFILIVGRTLPAGLLLYWFTSTFIMTVQQFMRYSGTTLKGEG